MKNFTDSKCVSKEVSSFKKWFLTLSLKPYNYLFIFHRKFQIAHFLSFIPKIFINTDKKLQKSQCRNFNLSNNK